ncbi:MAG: hypothetical protein BroJett030_23480 [Alphaproteobacteria bacterium]|nr:MAG: hypothetical protein BroJett030_23480 [Alphaproteobacteria bacterium]
MLSPVLFGLVGFAVDYSIFFSQRSRMQEVADGAALAAVREASLQGWNRSTAESVVSAFVDANLNSEAGSPAVYTSSVTVDDTRRTVTVSIRQDGHGYFLLGMFKTNPQIRTTSTGALAGTTNICVLTLDERDSDSLHLSGVSSLTANRCGVFANSASPSAIAVRDGARITAHSICSAGGYRGNLNDFSPEPVTDCPPILDPLAERKPPPVGRCDYRDLTISGVGWIRPGVYCGGLTIDGLAKVVALPGVYVIKDGPLEITGNAILLGDSVGFYLTGTTAATRIGTSTTISLSAPKSGPMAGILFFEDRNATEGRDFEISSKDARRLVGTIYLPKGRLRVKGASQFAGISEWTAIIANSIEVEKGPSLRLNSDYEASDVPVPSGIVGTERIYLSR